MAPRIVLNVLADERNPFTRYATSHPQRLITIPMEDSRRLRDLAPYVIRASRLDQAYVAGPNPVPLGPGLFKIVLNNRTNKTNLVYVGPAAAADQTAVDISRGCGDDSRREKKDDDDYDDGKGSCEGATDTDAEKEAEEEDKARYSGEELESGLVASPRTAIAIAVAGQPASSARIEPPRTAPAKSPSLATVRSCIDDLHDAVVEYASLCHERDQLLQRIERARAEVERKEAEAVEACPELADLLNKLKMH